MFCPVSVVGLTTVMKYGGGSLDTNKDFWQGVPHIWLTYTALVLNDILVAVFYFFKGCLNPFHTS